MKLRLPLSLFAALTALFVSLPASVHAVEVPEGYTSYYLNVADELRNYKTSSENLAFLLDGSVAVSSSTATWWQSEVLKSSGSILFTIEEDGDPYSLTFKDASYQAFDVSTLRIEDIGKVTFSGIKTTPGTSGYGSYGAIECPTISLLRNRGVSINNNNSQSGNDSSYDTRGGAIYTSSSLKINENTRGVTISDNYASATRSRSSSSNYSTSTSSSSYGGAIYGGDTSFISLNGNAGGLSLSGNYVYAYASDRNTYYSSYANNYNAASRAYAYAYGGAIYGGNASIITLNGNAGDLIISGNYASSSASASANARPGYLGSDSTAYTYAYGGAIYGGSSSIISLNDNEGLLTVSGNYTSTSTYLSYSCGGAIYGGSASSLTINGNTSGVRFIGNYAASTNSSSSVVTCGGAIYSEGSIAIQNNGDVIFSGNYEQTDSSYRLRSIYVNSSVTDGKFHLSAAAGKSITFEDSVYVTAAGSGQTIDVVFNGSYTDANGTIIAQEGDIIFDGGNAVDVLQGLKTNVSAAEILDSQTSYIGGVIDLQAGRLVVRNGAHLDGLGLNTKKRSGVALVLQDGYMDHSSSSINLFRDTSLELSGLNSITAETVSFSSYSTLQFTVGEVHRETAVLNLDANLDHFSITIALDGADMLASGRYKLVELADASLYTSDDYWNADDITVTATGDAAGLGFGNLVWENGVLYVEQGKSIWNNGSGDGVWNASSANWQRNGLAVSYRDGMDVKFDDSAAGTVQLEGAVSPLSVEVDNSTGHDYTFTGSGSLSGSTSLVKNGSGALNLATANEHTGGTRLNGGTLNVQHSQALGAAESTVVTAAGTQLNVTNNAAVVLAAAEGNDLAGQVSVSAGSSLEVKGTGYHAEATQLAGELIFSGAGVNHTGTGAGSLSGSGHLKVQGAGSLVSFSSAADFAGSVSLAEGAILGADVLEVKAGAMLSALAAGTSLGLGDVVGSGAAQVEMHTSRFESYTGTLNVDVAANAYTAGTIETSEGLVLQGGATYQATGSSLDLGGSTLTLSTGNGNPFVSLMLALDGTYMPVDTQIVLFTGVSSLVVNGVEFSGADTAHVFAASDYLKGDYVFETTALVYDGNVGCVYLVEAMPEPATTTLSLLALAGLCARRRRR